MPGIFFPLAAAVVALAALACAGPDSARDSSVADSADPAVVGEAFGDGLVEWPTDQSAYQLAILDSLRPTIPTCGGKVVVGANAVGPFAPGQTVSEATRLCPGALPLWDWGDDDVPEPVLLMRLGPARYELHFADTLQDSPMTSISTSANAARTAADIGPGSSFTEALEAYGEPVLFERECALYARFAAAPGLAFRLEGGRALECGDIPPIVEENDPAQLPSSTRVRTIVVTPP